jgi:hypothetical protein
MSDVSNDNHGYPAVAPTPEPDAHGQAAMLLVESLIHGLVDREVISVPDAISIVDIAAEVTLEVADDLGGTPETMQRSITILNALSNSLEHDT